MLSRLVAVILRVCTGRAAFIAFLLMIAGGYLLFQFAPYAEVRSYSGDAPLPEEGTAYEGGVASFLEEIGVEGRRLYLEFQFWDLLNPFLHAATFTLLIGWLIRRARFEHNWVRFAVLIPLFVGAVDLVENMLLIEAIHTYPGPGSGSALIPPVTAVKFLGAVLVMASTAILAVMAYLRRRAAPAAALIVILSVMATQIEAASKPWGGSSLDDVVRGDAHAGSRLGGQPGLRKPGHSDTPSASIFFQCNLPRPETIHILRWLRWPGTSERAPISS
jgi:hypothetical protein